MERAKLREGIRLAMLVSADGNKFLQARAPQAVGREQWGTGRTAPGNRLAPQSARVWVPVPEVFATNALLVGVPRRTPSRGWWSRRTPSTAAPSCGQVRGRCRLQAATAPLSQRHAQERGGAPESDRLPLSFVPACAALGVVRLLAALVSPFMPGFSRKVQRWRCQLCSVVLREKRGAWTPRRWAVLLATRAGAGAARAARVRVGPVGRGGGRCASPQRVVARTHCPQH